jgi:hypothetical protein
MGAPPSWKKKSATQHRQIQLAKGLRDASGPSRPLICVLAVGSPRCTFVTRRAFHWPRNIPRTERRMAQKRQRPRPDAWRWWRRTACLSCTHLAVFGELSPRWWDHEPTHCRCGVWFHASRMFRNDAEPEPGFHEVGAASRDAGPGMPGLPPSNHRSLHPRPDLRDPNIGSILSRSGPQLRTWTSRPRSPIRSQQRIRSGMRALFMVACPPSFTNACKQQNWPPIGRYASLSPGSCGRAWPRPVAAR